MTDSEQKWVETNNTTCAILRQLHDAIALSSLPPKRKWVGLTDEEILKTTRDHYSPHQRPEITFARAIEAKLKEKNT